MTDEKSDESNAGGEEVDSISEVDKVKNNLAELKAANDETEKELLRQEELRAKVQIGGKAETTQEAEKISPEDKKKAGAKEFFKGTPLAEAIDKL